MDTPGIAPAVQDDETPMGAVDTNQASSFMAEIAAEVAREKTTPPENAPIDMNGTPGVPNTQPGQPDPTQATNPPAPSQPSPEMLAMQQQMADNQKMMTEAMTTMAGAIADLRKPEPGPDPYAARLQELELDPETRDKFDESLPVIERLAQKAALEGDRKMAKEISDLRAAMVQRDEQFAKLEKSRQSDNYVYFVNSMSDVVNNPEAAVQSPEFREFLATPNQAFQGLAPEVFWDAASAGSNRQLGENVFKSFVSAEIGAKFARQPLSDSAVPPSQAGRQMPGAGGRSMGEISREIDNMERDYLYGSKKGQVGDYNEILRKTLEKMNQG